MASFMMCLQFALVALMVATTVSIPIAKQDLSAGNSDEMRARKSVENSSSPGREPSGVAGFEPSDSEDFRAPEKRLKRQPVLVQDGLEDEDDVEDEMIPLEVDEDIGADVAERPEGFVPLEEAGPPAVIVLQEEQNAWPLVADHVDDLDYEDDRDVIIEDTEEILQPESDDDYEVILPPEPDDIDDDFDEQPYVKPPPQSELFNDAPPDQKLRQDGPTPRTVSFGTPRIPTLPARNRPVFSFISSCPVLYIVLLTLMWLSLAALLAVAITICTLGFVKFNRDVDRADGDIPRSGWSRWRPRSKSRGQTVEDIDVNSAGSPE